MTTLVSEVQRAISLGATERAIALACAGSAAYGSWWALESRIRFRTRWAMKPPKLPKKSQMAWETAYDEAHNFAWMGPEYVDDDYGKRPTAKRKKKGADSSRETAQSDRLPTEPA